MTTTQSRIQVLNLPVALPGHCVMCGAVDGEKNRKYIDTGFSLDWFGAVYFCTFCIAEIVEAVGEFVPKQQHNEVILAHGLLEQMNTYLMAEVRRVKDVLRNLGIDPDRNYGDSVSELLPSVEVLQDDAGSNPVTEGSDQDSDEHVSVEEHRSIRSTATDSAADADKFLKSLES